MTRVRDSGGFEITRVQGSEGFEITNQSSR